MKTFFFLMNADYMKKTWKKMVPCAQCGRLHKYGEMYTSREVHTAYGFGFAVCRECYDDEMDRFLAEHPPFKEN
jgi:hypothetical protein